MFDLLADLAACTATVGVEALVIAERAASRGDGAIDVGTGEAGIDS
jgi:hypothetical protein